MRDGYLNTPTYMQYSHNELSAEATVSLTWHGEPTLVRLGLGAEKTKVDKGETIKVGEQRARELVRYSNQWTLSGDKPVKQPYQEKQEKELKEQQKKAAKKADGNNEDGDNGSNDEVEVDKMTKPQIVAKLKELNVSFNASKTAEELRSLLKEALEGAEDGDEDDKNDSQPTA